MKVLWVLCAIFGAFLALLTSTPVPDGLAEPWKYRLMMLTIAIPSYIGKLSAALFNPDNGLASIQVSRAVRSTLNYPLPAEVPGSNIRSKVMTFSGVRVRVYELIERRGKEPLPALIYIHGGGFALGSADGYDRLTRRLAESLDMVVISIDYRLSPENVFPAAYEDCLSATKYLLTHAADFGVDPLRVGISGDSAGGHLSAAVSQAILDDDTVPNLKVQVLIYPATQSMDYQTPSYQKYAQDFGVDGVLPATRVAAFYSMYHLGRLDAQYIKQIMTNQHVTESFRENSPIMKYIDHDVIPADLRRQTRNYAPPPLEGGTTNAGNATFWKYLESTYLDPRFAPLFREDMTGLPSAFITTCGFDTIRDDGIFYAKRLETAGVKTKWKNYDSAFHGIIHIVRPFSFEVGDEMTTDVVKFVRENI